MRPSDGRGVEQLAARRAHNPKVAGSSPAPATKKSVKKVFEGFQFFQKVLDEELGFAS